MDEGAAFTAMVRFPNGSVSKPELLSSSAIRAYSICCSAVSCRIIGISNCCTSTRPAACCCSTCSNRIRSCATCWSMIQRPSRPAAMMKLLCNCPRGRSSPIRSIFCPVGRAPSGKPPWVSGTRRRSVAGPAGGAGGPGERGSLIGIPVSPKSKRLAGGAPFCSTKSGKTPAFGSGPMASSSGG